MEHLFSKRVSRGTQKDEGDLGLQPKTLADMIEATKEYKDNTASARSQTWDCVVLESTLTNDRVSVQNKLADLAYQGDWEELLRMAIETPRLINSRRLQKKIAPGGAQGRPPAGYTALHQAAWHGAPVEIVQALINLGAHRMYPSQPHI